MFLAFACSLFKRGGQFPSHLLGLLKNRPLFPSSEFAGLNSHVRVMCFFFFLVGWAHALTVGGWASRVRCLRSLARKSSLFPRFGCGQKVSLFPFSGVLKAGFSWHQGLHVIPKDQQRSSPAKRDAPTCPFHVSRVCLDAESNYTRWGLGFSGVATSGASSHELRFPAK